MSHELGLASSGRTDFFRQLRDVLRRGKNSIVANLDMCPWFDHVRWGGGGQQLHRVCASGNKKHYKKRRHGNLQNRPRISDGSRDKFISTVARGLSNELFRIQFLNHGNRRDPNLPHMSKCGKDTARIIRGSQAQRVFFLRAPDRSIIFRGSAYTSARRGPGPRRFWFPQ